MAAYLRYLRYLVSSSFWFVPGLMTLAAVALAPAMLALDESELATRLMRYFDQRQVGPEAAREFLAAVAGSMITVASLVFSMTLIALSLTSNQLGPRVLKMFMGDRTNQVVLGTFTATFMYDLLVLRAIQGPGSASFVPLLAISVATILAVASLGVLILFIHHTATLIQADTVIAHLGRQLDTAIDESFPGTEAQAASDTTLPAGLGDGQVIRAPESGYIQAIDLPGLQRLTRRHDLVIHLTRRPGHFVFRGAEMGRVWPGMADETICASVVDNIILGATRTPTQDIEFAVRAIVDIALRALSAGINDAHTAIACIDRLGAALARLMGAPPPLGSWRDEDGRVRLVLNPLTFDGVMDSAFNEIRQSAGGNPAILIRLIDTLASLAEFAATPDHSRAIHRHGDMVRRAGDRLVFEPHDRADIETRLAHLDEALHDKPALAAQ